MTMNEKRYFKVFCSRHILGSQNGYVELFNILQKLNEFDEDLFKKRLKENNYSSKFISSDMNYLKKIILKSLNEFHSEKTIDIKIKNQLVSIEILFYKGLYEECLHLINKVKNSKLVKENQYLILEIINWERKCIGYSKGLLKAIEVNSSLSIYYDKLHENKAITDFYYKSYFYKNSVGKIPIKKIEKDFEVLFEDELFKTQLVFSNLHSEIFYNLIYSNYFHVIQDRNKELKFLELVIEIFNKNESYKEENPLDYISVHSRVIDLKRNSATEEFYFHLNQLKSFENIIDIQKRVAKERIFLLSNKAELEHLLALKNYNNVTTITENILEGLKENKYNIEPYYFISFYYLIASVYCSKGDFSNGLKFVNKILNEFRFEDRPNTFIKTEFLNIVIHYELKNYDLVLKNISTLNRKYTKTFKLSYFEKLILNTIFRIVENPYIINERNEFSKAKNIISNRLKVDDNLLNNNYLNYILAKSN